VGEIGRASGKMKRRQSNQTHQGANRYIGAKGRARVSSKQTKINIGSNRNKPKQDLFRVCFGLFRETKKKKILFVSVFRTFIETTETNRSVS
jgi:hypothetical protein